MKKTYLKSFCARCLTLLVLALLSTNLAWGEVVSGTTYDTKSTSSLPNGWTGSGSGTTYIQLIASSNYIQTSEFSAKKITSIKLKARTYGGPDDDQKKITVSWYSGSPTTETVLGTISPTDNTLTDYPISNIQSASGMGYVKIACKDASKSKGSGVSQVTITYESSDTPAGPSITCADITDVSYEGLTNATTTATFNNADGWTPSVTCDGEVVTSASIEGSTITYSVSENKGNADREGWFKITLSKEGETSIEKEVTVSQNHFSVDYVTLPFNWKGGTKEELTALNGVTANGLGTNYAAGNAPYRVKFDNDNDYIQIKTNEQIGIVTIGIKAFSGTKTSIEIQGSSDGNNFTTVQTFNTTAAPNNTETLTTSNSLNTNYRYIRIVRTSGGNVGVGPITIAKAAAAHTLSSAISPANAGTVVLGKTSIEDGQKTTAEATPSEGYRFSCWSITGTGASLSSTTDNPTTITMGSADATITANFEARTPATITWHHGQNGEHTKQVNTYADATIGTLETADEVNGWTFRGWSKSSSIEGTPEFVTETDVVGGDLDLYAVYSQGDNIFKLTTSVDDLEVDANYLIGAYDNGYYMMVFDSNFKKASSKTTLNGENQFSYSNGEILTLGGETDNWTFMTSDGKYFSSQSTSSANASLKKEDSATDYSYWSISYDSSSPEHAVIKNNGNATNNDKNINVSYYNDNFNVYGNQVVYLFKQIETLTYSTTPTADISVTITYVVDGVSTEERFDDGNATVKSEQPSKTGYDFKEWNTKEDGSGTKYVGGNEVNENLTLYAIWTIKSFSYTLNITGPDTEALASLYVNEEEIAEDATIDYNTEVTVEVAVNDGYMYSISVKDADENPIEVTNATFIMPASDVTVTVTTRVDIYVHDCLTSSDFTATKETYTDFSNVTKSSNAVYAGNSAKSSSGGGIQLRSKDNSGIITTTSGGFVRSITVEFESGNKKTLDIYGKNTPYAAASDLYNNSSKGTKIATVDGDGTYTITGDYTYIGIRSDDGARYVTSITIDWEPFKTQNVTIASSGYSSFSSTYAVTIPESITAYYATGVEGNKVSMIEVEGGVIPANEGVIIKGEAGKSYTFVETVSAETIEDNCLVAVSERIENLAPEVTIEDVVYKNYVFTGGQFHPFTSGATVSVGAGKAYLQVEKPSDPNAKLEMSFGEPTGIESLTPVLSEGKGVYNLNGLKVNEAYKGIVIMNGKKYINK